MLRKLLTAAALLFGLAILASVTFVLWLRSDAVRQTIVTQATAAFGTPVRIDVARATLFPRLGVELLNVSVGEPSRLRVDRASIATGLSVIWTRRVEDADIRLTGGSLDASLLAALADRAARLGDTGASRLPSQAPLSIVSIRSIRLRDVTMSFGGEQIPVSVDAALSGDRFTLTNGAAKVRGVAVQIEGHVSTSGPLRLTADISAPVATIGGHRAESLKARLDATPTEIVFDPMTFVLHGGQVETRVSLESFRPKSAVQYRGRVSGLDVTRLVGPQGGQKAITGRLGATFAIAAPVYSDSSALLETARGSVDIDIRDGRMPGIEAIREAIIRFANRADSAPQTAASDTFSELKATLTLRSGDASITKLTMAAEDFDIAGDGALALGNWGIALEVDVTLTEALSQQAGRDLYRYARDGRRIVLPATIGGTLFEPTASVNVGRAAGRALKNKAEDELKSLLDRVLKKR